MVKSLSLAVYSLVCIRLVTSWALHKSGWSIKGRCGWYQAITKSKRSRVAKPLSPCDAMSSSQNPRSHCRFIAGNHSQRWSSKLAHGGRPMQQKVYILYFMPIHSAKPNAWRWRFPTVRSGSIQRLMPYMLAIETRADRKSTRLNSSHVSESRMPSSA